MKLLIATPLYPPDIGGPATYAEALEHGLPQRGIAVEIVKFGDVRHLPKIIRHIVFFFKVRTLLKSVDLLLVLDPVSTGFPAMLAARSLGKPYVVKIVGDYAWEQGNQRFGVTVSLDEFVKLKKVPFFVGVLQKIQRKVAHHAVRVIVPSRYLKGVIQTWGIPEEKIEVIYNAVPNEKIGTVPDSVAQLPRPLVVSIGRLVPWKHMGRVIDAVAHAGGKGVLPSLAIVGGGPLRVSLMRIGREKLGSRCVLTGILSHRDTLSVLKQADVFVLNSSYEGLSHLLIEALTFGVPIITTRVGGNPEVINHDENGLLIEVGDTSGLESAIVRVLSDDALRARLSLRAKESAGRFTMETMIAETTAVLAKFQ